MSISPTLGWLRHDLRLADSPALTTAVAAGGPVIPVFIWAPEEEGAWAPGGATRWWLHQSLMRLEESLRQRGSTLILREGPSLKTLLALVKETGAERVVWHRRYEPEIIARDAKIKESLRRAGIKAESFNGALLHEPWEMQNKSGKPFQVFTPFWKTCVASMGEVKVLPAPDSLLAPTQWPESVPLKNFALEPRLPWAEGMKAAWQPGEAGAQVRLKHFLRSIAADYDESRNRPDQIGTSRLSPHFHFGEISPRQIWAAVKESGVASDRFLAEVGWREFAHHLLFHFPETPTRPLRPEFEKFPWEDNDLHLRAWQKGRTGFPIVDAGMRELWTTGWMHNRVRMIVASFLTKDLRLAWQDGAKWFWDTLVDADLAQNTLGWQWTAGCGADAAPYFRVFNPTTQGERHDMTGDYVRRWVPELARLPLEWLHNPSAAPAEVLESAGVILGKTYPHPIVDHGKAREAALAAFAQIKATKAEVTFWEK